MSEFAEIPAPLYEQLDGSPDRLNSSARAERETLSAQYMYYDDRAPAPES